MNNSLKQTPSSRIPTISIVLPTHNGSRYIDQSIDSVVRQTFQDWELIIVNDASSDNTPDIIDRWASLDDRITAVHLKKNRKLPGALNDGFAQARGAFHTWTSDDNWYHSQALELMAAVLTKEEDISVVCADRTNVDQFGSPIELSEAGSAEDLHIMNRIGACFLYRREVTDALNGYDEELFGAEDYDFWLRAALQFRFYRIPEPLYSYRYQPASISATKYHLIARNVELAVRRWLPQMTWACEATRLQAYIEWGVRCIRAGSWEDVYLPWLKQAEWVSEDTRCKIRRDVLKRVTDIVWEAHYRRDWSDVARYKEYLAEVSDDPGVARLLAKRIYPRWVYRVKDRLQNVCDRLRASRSA
jgi:glycosyltransferase involved in cell wall biosynthesis